MAAQTAGTLTRDEYTVGWVCALSKEQTAAMAMLDERHENLLKRKNDTNTYTLGSIGKHNVVIACLPKGEIGTNSAATVVTQMISTFPHIKVGLMVGIGGGIPPKVRLGDVVVSTPVGEYSGVVQWDMGKAEEGGNFKRTGSLNKPPPLFLTALSNLESENDMIGSKIPKHLNELKQKYPRMERKYIWNESLQDTTFAEDTPMNDVAGTAANSIVVDADPVNPREMHVHFGLIASGNQAIKDAVFRDKLDQQFDKKVLCVEMEAAGLMNNFPCIIIRGICDYADSKKNKEWQEHAAAVAAAFAKELLLHIQPDEVDREPPLKDVLQQVHDTVSVVREDTAHTRAKLDDKEQIEILNWLTPMDYGPQQSDHLSRRQPETGNWLLESKEFLKWRDTSNQTLFCPGIPGAGKTTLTSVVVDHLNSTFKDCSDIGIAYIYCNFKQQHKQKTDNLLASMLKQLSQCQSSLPDCIKNLHKQHSRKRTRPSHSEILEVLDSVVAMYSRVFVIIDALDECQDADECRKTFLNKIFNLRGTHKANIFATSRFIREIEDFFTIDDNSISKEIRAHPEDVKKYLESHRGQLPSFIRKESKLVNEVTESISQVVNGMFLLAKLYLESLSDKMTPNDIQSALETFQNRGQGSDDDNKSQILDCAYEQAMERVQDQMPGKTQLAMDVLLWITGAERQLTASELQHALATKTGKTRFDSRDMPDITDIMSVCAGLVALDEESKIIRLVHQTTQEYLDRKREHWFPGLESKMTTICITYLSFETFNTGFCAMRYKFEKRLRSYPFYDYAANNWGHHAARDEPTDRVRDQVLCFLQSEDHVEAASQAMMLERLSWFRSRSNATKMTGLHLAAYFGLIWAVNELLGLDHSPQVRDTFGRNPLWYSACNGHEAIAERLVLLAESTDVNVRLYSGPSPLRVAAQMGHLKIVETLLTSEVKINDDTIYDGLLGATEGDRPEVVKVLLRALETIDAVEIADLLQLATPGHLQIIEELLSISSDDQGFHGWEALKEAAMGGYLAIFEKLLAKGIEANATTTSKSGSLQQGTTKEGTGSSLGWQIFGVNDGTVEMNECLKLAAYGGDLSIVQALLTAGVDPKSIVGAEALQGAAWEGHIEVVEELLGAGVDIKAATGSTAIQQAAESGHFQVVERLLDAGAVTDAAVGSIVLQQAAKKGSAEVVEKLLAAGADANAPETSGYTALGPAKRDAVHLDFSRSSSKRYEE